MNYNMRHVRSESMKPGIEFSKKMGAAYQHKCHPLCLETGLPQTALDILLFLANNPEYRMARDIVELRHIKANLVSVHVERLVQEGYLDRRPVENDRRKTELVCTEKALPIIRRGQSLQEDFFAGLFDGVPDEDREAFQRTIEVMSRNLDRIMQG